MDHSTFGSIPFIPGIPPLVEEPLARYLPPIDQDVVFTYLHKNIAPGMWILDPFCASPRIALEAALAGYRILVTANNPISRFVLEMLADPPVKDELKNALSVLASSYIGDERVEPHIRSLYHTRCARCGQIVSADAFLWEHGNPSPHTRIYTCPNCGDAGEHPCTPYDVELSGHFSASGLHKARALERVVAATDQDRIHVEQALTVYIPRALYALVTIFNKIEGLDVSPAGQKYLSALLLHTFDQANALWRVSGQKERRKQLTVPRQFRENNVWLALENGINMWSAPEGKSRIKLPITIWPEQPPDTGGICIYEGRFSAFAEFIRNLPIKCVCTAIPRPNQAFWTLSALWAGWLWGRDAVRGFKSVLRRQRYDWAWHTGALWSVLQQLSITLPPATPVFGLIAEAEPGFIGSALIAAGVAGCQLDSLAIRPDQDQAQILWSTSNLGGILQSNRSLSNLAIQAAKKYLELKGEPANYLTTMGAAFSGISQIWKSHPTDQEQYPEVSPEFPQIDKSEAQNEPSPSAVYTSIFNTVREALSFRSGFIRFNLQDLSSIEAASKNPSIQSPLFSLDIVRPSEELSDDADDTTSPLIDADQTSEKERPTRSSDISQSTFLWLRQSGEAMNNCITDNYEVSLVNYLLTHPGCTIYEIDKMMCSIFPGLFTPDLEFISLCLESYAIQKPDDAGHWLIRQEDSLLERQVDLEKISRMIHQIGQQLGFTTINRKDSMSMGCIIWQDNKPDLEYWFFPTISAAISEIVLCGEQSPTKNFIVIPGSRANLVIYKLRRDPRLSKAFNPAQGDWRFIKFRHLRTLAEAEALNRDNLDQMLALDPITFSTPQLWLI
jgi:hypothetical protein